ncbi:hypothetical protein CWE08_01270 [Aliidiomarina iranensis]|uniref:KDP operon outer membrane protein n=1 Tax=Aliidiomarina iranensis TaxID=1434071 RepID=A0A432W259_9GAMM|nr:TorF family putative porin [Aliidiomarina iranensis]RUO23309.1 hypothetical protein CWE08_01270 [Aliidiomarina iranensis]
MKTKTVSITIALLAGLFSSATQAVETSKWQVSGDATLTTNYVFRGISQTSRGPAVQVTFATEHTSGLYASVWASNVNFGEGSLEVDGTLGWRGQLSASTSLDTGVIYYHYPEEASADEYDYAEIFAALDIYQFTFGLHHSDNYFGAGVGSYQYLYLSAPIFDYDGWQLSISAGYNRFSSASDYASFLGAPVNNDRDYWDGQLTLSRDFADGWSSSISYVNTSVSSAQCGADCGSQWLLNLSRSF